MDCRKYYDVDYDKAASKKQNTSTPICTETQTHVHEFEESTKLAEEGDDRHNHRVAGVTSEVIQIGNGRHVHAFGVTNTDFLDHHHEIGGTTGPDVPIPNSTKHVHLISGTTTTDDGHEHDFLFTTQINSPLV
jgi:hypothetical protein